MPVDTGPGRRPRGGRALLGIPAWWGQTAFAIGGEFHVGVVETLAVPELARDLAVALVERFAVVRVEAETDSVAAAGGDLAEPLGVGESLAREPYDGGWAGCG